MDEVKRDWKTYIVISIGRYPFVSHVEERRSAATRHRPAGSEWWGRRRPSCRGRRRRRSKWRRSPYRPNGLSVPVPDVVCCACVQVGGGTTAEGNEAGYPCSKTDCFVTAAETCLCLVPFSALACVSLLLLDGLVQVVSHVAHWPTGPTPTFHIPRPQRLGGMV